MEFDSEINTECAFHIKNNDEFCAPPVISDKLKEFAIKIDKSAAGNPKKALAVLKNKYLCESEVCVLNNSEIKQIISKVQPIDIDVVIKDNFKPTGPRETKDWLSNFDIDSVLRQIKEKYTERNFFHIPFQMLDFQKTNSELERLNWPEEYGRGYRTFGTVMNTDYHTGTGEHWFAIFGDFSDELDVFTIEYFNSVKGPPKEEILAWVNGKILYWRKFFKKDIKFIAVTENINNQRDSYSCGAYSLYYIISRLDGIPYVYFMHNLIGDKKMVEFRKYLFRKE